MPSSLQSIAILGAGITGLAAAHRLVQGGHRVRVFESSDRVGGAIRTEAAGGWLSEAGPNSLVAGDPVVAKLLDELGLAPERVEANALARNRYILHHGQLRAVPLSPPALLTTSLFSLGAKVRLLSEFFASRRVRTIDLSLEEFVCAHVGQEVVDYVLNPFVAGVYAGNPKKLSARHAFPQLWEMEQLHGSLLRGQMAAAKARKARGEARPAIISFRRGLQVLPETLAARLPAGVLSLQARVEAFVPTVPAEARTRPGPPWSVIWTSGTSTQTEKFDAVLTALPAPALAQLRFGTLGERPLAALDTIEHPPVASLFLGFRREQVKHPLDGFGLLIPEIEKRSLLGVLFCSTLFPGRAPAGHVALTVLAGGTRQPEIARLPAEKLWPALERDLRELLGITGPPAIERHTFWPRAIPQYNLGYEVHLETIAAAERAHRGLFIGGQARDGISLPACIAAGEKLAARAVG